MAIVDADPDQLRVAITNLILNAAQAMDHSGTIAISVDHRDDRLIDLVIADSGPGIPIELREKVLEPFFTTKHRGTGLGLPTARRIVEAHGGTLAIESSPAGGTAVRISLPRLEPA
jgi:signal transduction histidine kinase